MLIVFRCVSLVLTHLDIDVALVQFTFCFDLFQRTATRKWLVGWSEVNWYLKVKTDIGPLVHFAAFVNCNVSFWSMYLKFCDGIILKIDLKFGRLNKLLKLNVVMYLFLSDEVDSMKNQIARHIEPH